MPQPARPSPAGATNSPHPATAVTMAVAPRPLGAKMPDMAFTDAEIERYARHLVLREVGGPGQQKLKAASALIVGAGGLGSPAALYLAAAGIGTLILVDPDEVDLSNLQRQVLYTEDDLGRPKAEAGTDRLAALNPHIFVAGLAEPFSAANADELLEGVDMVLD